MALTPFSSRRLGHFSTGLEWLWHGTGVVAALLAGSLLGWYHHRFWMFGSDAYGMVGLVALSYIGSVVYTRRMLSLARTEAVNTVLVSLLSWFLLTSAVLVVSGWYYSRTYLLGAFVMAFVWQLLYLWRQGPEQYRLALVPGGLVDALPRVGKMNLADLDSPRPALVQAVVLDPHVTMSPPWARFVAEQSLMGVPLLHAAVVYERLTGRVSLEHYSVALLEGWRLPGLYPQIKRLLDVGLILVTLPLTLPFMGLMGLLIRLELKGPALFWQERLGQGGRPFWLVKFRTMRADAEENGARFAEHNDQRITRLGRFMRRYRLDELPQLWNVLRGEMSLVGPRPEQLPFAERFAQEIPLYSYRQLLKPGLTGWAQVHHGYAAGTAETTEKLTYDLYYLKHLSWWLDLLILSKTARTILTGFGVR